MLTRAIEVLTGKGCWGPLQSKPLGNTVTPSAWKILVALPFSLFLASQEVSALPVSGYSETEGPLCSSLKGWGIWSFTLLSFSQGGALSLGSFLLVFSSTSLRDETRQAKRNCSSYPFVQLFSVFLLLCVAEVSKVDS